MPWPRLLSPIKQHAFQMTRVAFKPYFAAYFGQGNYTPPDGWFQINQIGRFQENTLQVLATYLFTRTRAWEIEAPGGVTRKLNF